MIATALFYTFSTIAQTLAGAIALLGAFVLYRFQTLNTEFGVKVEKVLVAFNSQEIYYIPLQNLSIEGKYKQFHQYAVEKWDKALARDVPGYKVALDQLGQLVEYRDTILQGIKRSLIWTVVTLTYSVLMLAISPLLIARCESAVWLAISIGVVCFGVCIIRYSGVIWKALR